MKRALPFLAAALLVSGCTDEKKNVQSMGGGEMPPLPVKAVGVKHTNETYSKTYSAILKPFLEVDVVARVKGYLVKKNFTEGAFVKKGEVLYEIQKEEFLAALNVAKANVVNAEATASRASNDWNRAKTLYENRAISTEQRDAVLYAYDSANAKLQESRAALDNAKLNYGYTTITAPIGGIAGMKTNDVGSYIGVDTKLTTITTTDPMYVEFSLPSDDIQRYLAHIKVGSDVTILYGKNEIIGKIDFVSPKVDANTDTLLVRAKIDNPKAELIIGSFVEVRLDGFELDNVAKIPQASLIKTQDATMVWVIKDGGVVMKKVIVATTKDGEAIIKTGLDDGDMVVSSNIAKIRPTTKVTIMEGN